MVCSLNCFCDFIEAKSAAQRASVIKKYQTTTSGPMKGMVVYYRPVVQMLRGRLCPTGTVAQKLVALRSACVIDSWTDKLNETRAQANVFIFRAVNSEFAGKKLKIFPNPRMQCLVSSTLAINLSPELYAEVDGVVMMWKFAMSAVKRSEGTIRTIIQMLARASIHKGLQVPIDQIRFYDVRAGKIYSETAVDIHLEQNLLTTAKQLVDNWPKAA